MPIIQKATEIDTAETKGKTMANYTKLIKTLFASQQSACYERLKAATEDKCAVYTV